MTFYQRPGESQGDPGQGHLRQRDKKGERPEGGAHLACARVGKGPAPRGTGTGPLWLPQRERTGGGTGRAGTQYKGSHIPSSLRPALFPGSQSVQSAASQAKPWVPVGTSNPPHATLPLAASCCISRLGPPRPAQVSVLDCSIPLTPHSQWLITIYPLLSRWPQCQPASSARLPWTAAKLPNGSPLIPTSPHPIPAPPASLPTSETSPQQGGAAPPSHSIAPCCSSP